jgi:hypothetical protein
VGRPLWREDGSVFCMCHWPLPAQSFSGPSPLGLAPVFYSLRFETSLFVASYDSQGHGGGIRPRLHTGGHCTTGLPIQSRGGHIENTSVAQQWIYVNHIESTFSFIVVFTAHCIATEIGSAFPRDQIRLLYDHDSLNWNQVAHFLETRYDGCSAMTRLTGIVYGNYRQ